MLTFDLTSMYLHNIESNQLARLEISLCRKLDNLRYHPDFADDEEEDVKADGRTYVTRVCEGRPHFDSGKFHNHCTECPGFGICIGDYREAHCDECGKHYFAGLQGFPCPCQGRRRGRGFGDSDDDNEESECVLC